MLGACIEMHGTGFAQVAAWLHVEHSTLASHPTPRSLAAAMQRRSTAARNALDSPGGAAASVGASAGAPSGGSSGRAAAVGVQGREAEAAAEQQSSKRPRLLSADMPAQSAGPPDQAAPLPPNPRLGGWVVQRCGQIRHHPPAEPSAKEGAAQTSNRDGLGAGSRAEGTELCLHWRLRMRECVDASPLVLVQPAAGPDQAAHDRCSLAPEIPA
jgi:hypothetical protein